MSLQNFIDYALSSTSRNEIYTIDISDETCKIIEQQTHLNINTYSFIIEEEYVRHVRNEHEEDLDLLYHLPDIINSCTKVEKSITKNSRTGQTDVSLVFKKKMHDDTVQIVALRIYKKKVLSLKTLFVV